MIELRIQAFSGVCNGPGRQILGLGNDIYQIAVGLLEAEKLDAVKLTVNEADELRFKRNNVRGIIELFPSLKNGIYLRDGSVQGSRYGGSISRHWQMADYDSSELRRVLLRYFKPHITDHLQHNSRILEDTLVIHLRGGDALDEWTQNTWRPSPLGIDFYEEVIRHSGLEKIHIVTTPPKNGTMHPTIEPLRRRYNATIQHDGILEDFSVLSNCCNLVLDFSTFGYTAALMNVNLEKVFISKFVDKKGVPLLRDIASDVGFTFPRIGNGSVHVYDLPEHIIKT